MSYEQAYKAVLRNVNGVEVGVFENEKIQLSQLEKGVYFVGISMNKQQIIKRVIVL